MRRFAPVIAAALAAATPAPAQDGPPAPEAPPLFRPEARAPLPDAPNLVDLTGSAPQAREQAKHFFDPTARVAAADEAYAHPWAKRVAAAREYARSREGRVGFAVIDEEGRLRGWRVDEQHRSASLVKAMFLVAYLGRIPDTPLTRADRALLRPMIVRSDNDAATRVLDVTGPGRVYGVARRAGMERFVLKTRWGDTLVTAADQARLFARIDLLVPRRHRAYARKLLASVVEEQRWGTPRVLPEGWRIYFKGGWRPLSGRNVVNESALLEKDARRVAIAVLTHGNPSHSYGAETLRGVARRVLRGLR
jgi:hypothetical protein